jgi:hypothetical protein
VKSRKYTLDKLIELLGLPEAKWKEKGEAQAFFVLDPYYDSFEITMGDTSITKGTGTQRILV